MGPASTSEIGAGAFQPTATRCDPPWRGATFLGGGKCHELYLASTKNKMEKVGVGVSRQLSIHGESIQGTE